MSSISKSEDVSVKFVAKGIYDEKRQYIRLSSVFPVAFRIILPDKKKNEMNWQQGYTCNVSNGGICVETNAVDNITEKLLNAAENYVDIRLSIPLRQAPIEASAKLIWSRCDIVHDTKKYFFGLKFEEISPRDLRKVVWHAKVHKYAARASFLLGIILVISLSASFLYNQKLRYENKMIVSALVNLEEKTGRMAQSYEVTQKQALDKEKELQSVSESDLTSKKRLENEYEDLVKRLNQQADSMDILDRKKQGLQKTISQKMYLWLKNHQSYTTGLVLSFEGKDKIVKDWSFIYDQALAVCVFLLYDDTKSARDILNFFTRELTNDFNGFNNAFFYDSGDISEFTVHCGPNIWLGIAALQYVKKTSDYYYLDLAKRIADWLIEIQEGDPEGGLKGGPTVFWFSTEHNLDAYAFLNMLYNETEEEKYGIARDKIKSWLNNHAMVPHDRDYSSPPINRGRGDATIATDTFAWALASLGPQELKDMGMDPEEIMKFAEENCSVATNYVRPSGIVVNVKGFDFSKVANMPRGGLVSPEWTSQMIVSFRMLSRYFKKNGDDLKAEYYAQKANIYLNELNKIVISSASPTGRGEGCLPYATKENADTGHGWNTPNGNNTCSIAGTAYMVMAIKDFNPLSLEQN